MLNWMNFPFLLYYSCASCDFHLTLDSPIATIKTHFIDCWWSRALSASDDDVNEGIFILEKIMMFISGFEEYVGSQESKKRENM